MMHAHSYPQAAGAEEDPPLPTLAQVRSYEDSATRTNAAISTIDPIAIATRISAYSIELAPSHAAPRRPGHRGPRWSRGRT